jgi:rhamnosyltransferase
MTGSATVGVVVVTHRAREHLERCLPPLLASSVRPRVLVVNSSSHDGTVETARALGADTLVVARCRFNHGSTRELARRRLATDVVVMMTPDAYPADDTTLDRLVAPVLAEEAAVAYGRQVPRPEAGVFERFLRAFGYPAVSHVRSVADAEHHGAYLTFCSNAFAAYRQRALDEIGGFRATLSHEDAIAAALLLRRGHRIAYVAEAVVEHSHPTSLRSEFRRYFDAGYAREQFRDALAVGGSHRGLGRRYVAELAREVARERPWLLPYAGAHVVAKGAGYWLGKRAVGAPDKVNRYLSGQDYYWAGNEPEPAFDEAVPTGRSEA